MAIEIDSAWAERIHPFFSADYQAKPYGELIADRDLRHMVRGLTAERVIRPTNKEALGSSVGPNTAPQPPTLKEAIPFPIVLTKKPA